jgi:hypothetical protein
MRVGEHTVEDIALLISRQISQTNPMYPAQATHVFAYNKDFQHHNCELLLTMSHNLLWIVKSVSAPTIDTSSMIINFMAANVSLSIDNFSEESGM